MKKLFLILILFFTLSAKSQTITHARFVLAQESDSFQSIDLEIDDKFAIGISGEGELLYIETLEGNELFEGDYERLGIAVKYYTNFDIHDIAGRLKSIGNIEIKFNNAFDIHDLKGTIKSIGDLEVKYYNVFDIHDPKGSVKSVGNVSFKYYTVFDPDRKFGELKSISSNTKRLSVIARKKHYD
ncbi:MAG: hypothetical protein H7069_02055 [Phormidesmis sp. FL-bin-119]|nr:hypothetical protein [Pedobacter sp.]